MQEVLTEGKQTVLKADFSSSPQGELEGDDQRGNIKNNVPPGDISTWWARSRGRSNSRKKPVGAAHPGSGPDVWRH